MEESTKNKRYRNSIFFCYLIDKSIYNKKYFSIDCPNHISELDFDIVNYNNLSILRVFFISDGWLSNFLSLNNSITFKIIYKVPNQNNSIVYESQDFTVEKNRIKFEFNAANSGRKNSKLFKNPSCLNQYNSFSNLKGVKNTLFSDTLEYLKNNLDLLLYIHLLKNASDKQKEDLIKIFDNFPNFNIIFDEDIYNANINFQFFIPKGIDIKLKTLISIIKDSSDTFGESYEGCIKLIDSYNTYHKECQIPIKKNFFNLLINKSNKKYIKKIIRNCQTFPILLDYLSSIKSDKINNLTTEDIPINLDFKQNYNEFIELIDKYEKIKTYFKPKEILKIWQIYIDYYIKKSNIKELEIIKDKFSLIDKNYYGFIIDNICCEIINKGKKMILEKELKGVNMYEFINKYNNYGEFLYDAQLLAIIAQNINLKELEYNEGKTLEEFNKCKFFSKIRENQIKIYIKEILSQLNDFEEFSLFFKYIYKLKTNNEISDNKDTITSDLIISHFKTLVQRINSNIISFSDNSKETIKKIIISSLKYIEEDKKNNYKDIIVLLSHKFNVEILLKFFINDKFR